MKVSLRPLLSATALGFSALLSPAMAADYDPPIVVDQPVEEVPVEVGSGWYLRGDVNYNFGDPVYDFEFLGSEVDHQRFGGGGGIGYHFTDYFRSDVTVNYLGGDRLDYTDGINIGTASHTVWSGMLNGYVDIATVMGFTPYVGAGVGLTYSRNHIINNVPADGTAIDWMEDETNFAYGLMAGASYELADNFSVDLGYQFLSTPGMQYLNTDSFTVEKGVNQHLVRLGLRYDLW